jgi:hypothetical protein
LKTYNQISKELFTYLVSVKDNINFNEYLSKKYFNDEFITKIKGAIELGEVEDCKCAGKYLSKDDFDLNIRGMVISKHHRDDWMASIKQIFTFSYITYLQKNSSNDSLFKRLSEYFKG